MRILVVNDDGISAKGISILSQVMTRFGSVFVVAPNGPRSAFSHAITMYSDIEMEHYDLNGLEAYQISGTPADCVRVGLHLFKDIDLLVSGVNNGYNLGEDIHYSGTAGAALEGTLHGIPSIAFSVSHDDFSIAEKELENVMTFILNENLLNKDIALNVNFPYNCKETKGIRVTRQAFQKYSLDFKTVQGKLRYSFCESVNTYDKDTDVYAVNNGLISITPLNTNFTDFSFFEEFKKSHQ